MAEGSTWRYLDDGTDPGEGWTAIDYDDSAWSTGPALLGFGVGDEATLLRCRPELEAGAPCPEETKERTLVHFLRHEFTVDDPAAFDRLRLGLMKDDGAVVYLNGEEVARSNLRLGFQGPGVEAAHAVEDPRVYFDYRLPASAVREGENVLAAEVHLADPGDPTLGFDLRLVAYAPSASPVDRRPYVTGTARDRAVVRWRTGDAVGSILRWGESADALDRETVDEVPKKEHRVVLEGLEPGATYHYRVADPRGRVHAETRRFTTLPAGPLARPVRLWFLGSPGTGERHAARVRHAFLRWTDRQPPDAWIVLGNLGFQDGSDVDYQKGFFDAYPELLAARSPWPILGNHDMKSIQDGAGPYFDVFELPTEGEAGGAPSGTERYYAFEIGPVHVVALDTATYAAADKEMLEWLREDLAAVDRAKTPWLVVVAHHPPYSAGWRRSDDPVQTRLASMRDTVAPILERAGADLVVSGHNPSYERSHLLRDLKMGPDGTVYGGLVDAGDGRPDGDGAYTKRRGGPGTVYVVAGSGALLVEADLDHPAMAVSLASRGSLVVDADEERLVAVFLDADGQVADRFVIAQE